MTTSSEDVLLSVGGVRYKKGDGTLYVMNQRLAWMLENRDTVAVSHKYADIKSKYIKFSVLSKHKLRFTLSGIKAYHKSCIASAYSFLSDLQGMLFTHKDKHVEISIVCVHHLLDYHIT